MAVAKNNAKAKQFAELIKSYLIKLIHDTVEWEYDDKENDLCEFSYDTIANVVTDELNDHMFDFLQVDKLMYKYHHIHELELLIPILEEV